ncbi:hypothetical protein B5T_01448 [Alloalcanivorax dieselolei B5]|uniref:PA2779 family protein n=1 Tax=Alcanivorax dieselolei (strain DSM 16502 / CGMCC 1.3690 / MCCC 1A00001 / B-5) TaxID=930169 RepID=K0CB49_ALCDB|nr:PA2779 family protein [Alloalcanivorax dieselolei]AFT69730.1 hypothetical protein B5T_01448 [Alloalcanivorax dieselolei B5]GGJ86592.1 hypothetical protein GCM10007426_14610 [Alloalcanivorax dieselolei]
MNKRLTGVFTATVLLITQALFVPMAHAAMVGTDTLVASEQRAAMEQKVLALLEHKAAAKVLADNGVSPEQVKDRLDRLSDQELTQLAEQADELPAGQGVIGVILAIILILVLLDLLGATNVFPAIHPIN